MSDVKILRAADNERELPVFAEFDRKMDEVRERAFDLFSSRGGGQGRDLDDWITAERELLGWSTAELKERPEGFEVDITLPGFEADDVELTATQHDLIVRAARKDERSGRTDHIVWSEFGSSDVYRRLTLPADVQTASVTAELKNGVLRVYAPKSMADDGPAAEAEC
jgi:HSP20 family protein